MIYPDIPVWEKREAYLARYGQQEERAVMEGADDYSVDDCWDLAYDALQQGKKLQFVYPKVRRGEIPKPQHRYTSVLQPA